MKFVMNSGDVKLTDRKNVAVTWNETGTSCPSSCMFHPEPDAVGEAKRDAKLNPAEHAAWSSLCLMILNLDETLSKE